MNNNEHYEGDWLIVDLVPNFIQANTAIQFGSPTVIGGRVHTEVAAVAYQNKEWDDYGSLTEQQALIACAFEAGREYQRNRKLRKRIDEACQHGWELHNIADTISKADDVAQPEAIINGDVE